MTDCVPVFFFDLRNVNKTKLRNFLAALCQCGVFSVAGYSSCPVQLGEVGSLSRRYGLDPTRSSLMWTLAPMKRSAVQKFFGFDLFLFSLCDMKLGEAEVGRVAT